MKIESRTTSFRLPAHILEKLQKEAASEGRSMNNLLIKILNKSLKK